MPNTGEKKTDSETTTPKAWFWPAFIITLLAGQILLILVMVYLATSDRSFAVEPNYYQKGLHWDQIAAQQRRNEQLGWNLDVALGEPEGPLGVREFRCLLTDRDGGPLDSALVDVVAFPHVRAVERDFVTLEPAGSGLYRIAMRFRRKGLWEFRFVVRHEGETFTFTKQQNVEEPN